MRTPRLYLGTMTFAWSQTSSRVDEHVALEMVQRFIAHHEKYGESDDLHLDTARIYAGGKTEAMVGAVLAKLSKLQPHRKLLIGTKAHPSQPAGLSAEGIQTQWRESLSAMNANNLPLPSSLIPMAEFYLHQPDTEHSILESLEYVHHQLVSPGQVIRLGMSNYHVREMERVFQLCQQHQLTPPTVYQGLYNPLNRAVEEELLPLLKSQNCSFVAYNPLAAGLLTGKHQSVDQVAKGRFQNNPNYLPRFYTPANFDALELIRRACETEGITMVEATYRWLLCHSALGANDGVLLGASSVEQLQQNLDACAAAREKGPLSDQLLQAFDQGWTITQKEGAFPYWRSYSADMPNRDHLDQGASYQAAKKV